MGQNISKVDFIIVGGGSAGCVLANRLTDATPYKVLLIEAGPRDTNPWIHIPIGYGKNFRNPAINWMLRTEPGERWVKTQVPTPRGKVIGGSSSINGMVYMRGNQDDFNHWQQLGNKGWGWKDVMPLFKRAEHWEGAEAPERGINGPLMHQPIVPMEIVKLPTPGIRMPLNVIFPRY